MGAPQRIKRNRGALQVPTEHPRMLQHPAVNMRPTVVCETGERCGCATMVSEVLVPPKRVTFKLKWMCSLGMGPALEELEVACRRLIGGTDRGMGLHRVLFPLGESVRARGNTDSERAKWCRVQRQVPIRPVRAQGVPVMWNLQVPVSRPREAPKRVPRKFVWGKATQ